jgi:hypothetical protein
MPQPSPKIALVTRLQDPDDCGATANSGEALAT